jgi:hypothetical protein
VTWYELQKTLSPSIISLAFAAFFDTPSCA